MGNIFAVSNEKSLMLYHQGHTILLLATVGEMPCRPTALAKDFACSLSETVYNQTLYYTYLNVKNDILVKSILDNSVLFTLPSTEAIHYNSPHIVAFGHRLLLFYVIKNPLNEDFMVKSMVLFDENTISDSNYLSGLSCSFPKLPEIKTFSMSKKLLILFSASSEYRTFLLTEQLQILTLEDNRDKNALLAKQTATIESIKIQYNDLMQTASQYREEARKWYQIARGHP